MTKSRDLWQLLQGLRAERAVIAWNAYVIRVSEKMALLLSYRVTFAPVFPLLKGPHARDDVIDYQKTAKYYLQRKYFYKTTHQTKKKYEQNCY